MTFLEIRQRIAELCGLDVSDTTSDNNATILNKLKEWVNARYRYIGGCRNWNWLLKNDILQTAVEITTGTVDVTNGDTAITFSTGPTPSVANWRIQFGDSDDWYDITAHTATQTGATLSDAYLGTTSSTQTYKLRKVYYSLPSDLAKVITLRQARSDYQIADVNVITFDRIIPDPDVTGNPRFHKVIGKDSSGNYQLCFYPTPDDEMNIDLRYSQVVTELSDDADVPLIPLEFHDLLVWDTLATYGYMFVDDNRILMAKKIADEIMKKMVENEVTTSRVTVRQKFDSGVSNPRLQQQSLPLSD